MECWQPLGLPVVPLEYMRNSGASAGIETGATFAPLNSGSTSSTK